MDEISPEVSGPSSLEDASWGDAISEPNPIPVGEGDETKTEIVELMNACAAALEGAALTPKSENRPLPLELALFSAAELAATPLPIEARTEAADVAALVASTHVPLVGAQSADEASTSLGVPGVQPELDSGEPPATSISVAPVAVTSEGATAPQTSSPGIAPLLAEPEGASTPASLALVAGAPVAEAAAAGESAPEEIAPPSAPEPEEIAAAALAVLTEKQLSPSSEVFAPSVMVLPSVLVSAELLNLSDAERTAVKALPPLVFDERQQPKTEPDLSLPDHVAPVSELAGAELAVLAPEEPAKPIQLTVVIDNAGPIITPLQTPKVVIAEEPMPPDVENETPLFWMRLGTRLVLTGAALGVAAFGFFSPPPPRAAPPARTARPSRAVSQPRSIPEPVLESPALEAEAARQADPKAGARSHPSQFSWTGIKGLSWKKHSSSPRSVAAVRIGRPANPAPLPGTEPTFVDPDLQGEMAKVK